MSLATRCTQCGTIFKVVQDQLKVSEGWVRCGRCTEVFNALPGLFDLDRDPPPLRPATAPARDEARPPPPPAMAASGLRPTADSAESVWPTTAPTPRLEQDDLALDEHQPPHHPPIDALLSATDFELDTSVAMPGQPDPPALRFDLDAPALATRPPHAEPPLAPGPPEFPPGDLPVTSESDALDSRYLMPSDLERPPRLRRRRGPDFADAQFPTDALGADLDDGASDFGPSSTPHPDEPAAPSALVGAAPMPANAAAGRSGVLPSMLDADPVPVALTTAARVDDDFVPEQALQPPSQRRGRPGTRGRDPAVAQPPEFVRRAQRQAFWRHPATRALLALVALSLVLGLALQAMHQFRDVLAAQYPEARPYLAQWCATVGCKLEAPRRIEGPQVESATLVRLSSEGADSYRLAVVVHNRSGLGLAWPHVDLTLTDTEGAVVARRAFSPRDAQWVDSADSKAEPNVPAGPVPTAAPPNRSTTLQWRLEAPNLKLAGYTAELFYP